MENYKTGAKLILEKLEKQLKDHDWYYAYSEDSRVYKNGADERDKINNTIELLEKIGKKDEADELFEKHQPNYPEVTD